MPRARKVVGDVIANVLRKNAPRSRLGHQGNASSAVVHPQPSTTKRVQVEQPTIRRVHVDNEPLTEISGRQKFVQAQLNIYNYAARFGLLPRIRTSLVAGTSKYEVYIDLPEQGIRSSAIGDTEHQAGCLAAERFKEKAEQYWSQRGHGQLLVKDPRALTVWTAPSFLKFYRSLYGPNLAFRETFPISRGTTFKNPLLDTLTQALLLAKRHPDLLSRFAKSPPDDAVTTNIEVSILEDVESIMGEVLEEIREYGLPAWIGDLTYQQDNAVFRSHPQRRGITGLGRAVDNRGRLHTMWQSLEARSQTLKQRQELSLRDPNVQEFRQRRKDLSINRYRDEVLEAVSQSPVSMIIANAGSGKTSQIPQMLLEDAIAAGSGANCNIVCTQTRRIPTMSISARVAAERNEPLSETVGYKVRFNEMLPQRGGSITYCTAGVLLMQLTKAPDVFLSSVSHLIIDDLHESDEATETLVTTLKILLEERERSGVSNPYLVLMGAVADPGISPGYFGLKTTDTTDKPCPVLQIPDNLLPVEEKFLDEVVTEFQTTHNKSQLGLCLTALDTQKYISMELMPTSERQSVVSSKLAPDAPDAVINWEGVPEGDTVLDGQVPVSLVGSTIAHIATTIQEGAILVFLPDVEAISRVHNFLRQESPLGVNFNNSSRFRIFHLYPGSRDIPGDLHTTAPPACRTIILSTDVSESWVPYPDVRSVIDTGLERLSTYDQALGMETKSVRWVSRASVKRRSKLAGRVVGGRYYALYTRERYEAMSAHTQSALSRSDLQQVALLSKIHVHGLTIGGFLAKAPNPPTSASVDNAIHSLQALGALTEEEELTHLGRLIAFLPLRPPLGKMVILGVIFRCLDPIIVLAAALQEPRSLWHPVSVSGSPETITQQRRDYAKTVQSDHLGVLAAFLDLRQVFVEYGIDAAYEYAEAKHLSMEVFRDLYHSTRAIKFILRRTGIVTDVGEEALNYNSGSESLIRALVLTGLYPQLAVHTGNYNNLRTLNGLDLFHGPSDQWRSKIDHALWAFSDIYSNMHPVDRSMRSATLVTPMMTALFGGQLQQKEGESGMLTLGGKLDLNIVGNAGAANMLYVFRVAMDRVLEMVYRELLKPRRSRRKDSEINALCDMFVQGVVDILERDAGGIMATEKDHKDKDFALGGSTESLDAVLDKTETQTDEGSAMPSETLYKVLDKRYAELRRSRDKVAASQSL